MNKRIKKLKTRALAVAASAFFAAVLTPNPGAAQGLPVTGVVRAEEEVVVRSEYPGIVQRIAVREGDRVREGGLLIEMRNERQKLSLELSQTGLAKAKASVEETKVLLDNAQKELSRVKTAGPALPRKEVEDKTDQVLRLEANLSAQRAELEQAETEVKLREYELRETHLLAPFAGTVTQIHIEKGDTLRPLDTPILEIVALDDLFAELLLPSSAVQKIHENQKLKVQVEGEWMGREGLIEGTVSYINPKVDASSRTFLVKIRIPSKGGIVRPGMLVVVQIE